VTQWPFEVVSGEFTHLCSKGQVIARGEAGRNAKGVHTFVLPGAVMDNRQLIAMVVHASEDRREQMVEIGADPVWLVKEETPKDGAQSVDTESVGFKVCCAC
jgi:hypothetical protein